MPITIAAETTESSPANLLCLSRNGMERPDTTWEGMWTGQFMLMRVMDSDLWLDIGNALIPINAVFTDELPLEYPPDR